MPYKDYQKKEPSKSERALFELAMRQEMIERNLWTNSAFMSALAMLMEVDPQKIAELLTNGNDKIKEYSGKINEAIEKLEKEKKISTPGQAELPSEATETEAVTE